MAQSLRTSTAEAALSSLSPHRSRVSARRFAAKKEVISTGAWLMLASLLLVTSLKLMPDCNDQDRFPVIAVQRDITAVAKVDQPFAVFRLHILDGESNLWVLCKDIHPGTNRFYGPTGRVGVFSGKEAV